MKIKAEAKILLKESVGRDGMIDAERVSAVCDYVESEVSLRRKTPLLREYRRLVSAELRRENALIETSGEVGDESFEKIKAFVKSVATNAPQNLQFTKAVNPKLLGGVRIKYGDNIWERSARVALETIR